MRQFISAFLPDKKGILEISGKDYRYLRQVLRVKPGDMMCVRLPDETLVNTTVCEVNEEKRRVILQLCDGGGSITRGVQADSIQENAFRTEFTLFQFIPKPVKMELILRQAVECGVKYIVPVIGEFTQSSSVEALRGAKKERFQRIIREARQQSGSPVETEIAEPVTLEKALCFWKEESAALSEEETLSAVLWERSEETKSVKQLFSECKDGGKIKSCCVAVGSEGGISPSEVETMKGAGFIPVHFATNVLRCETAALYGIASLQSGILF